VVCVLFKIRVLSLPALETIPRQSSDTFSARVSLVCALVVTWDVNCCKDSKTFSYRYRLGTAVASNNGKKTIKFSSLPRTKPVSAKSEGQYELESTELTVFPTTSLPRASSSIPCPSYERLFNRNGTGVLAWPCRPSSSRKQKKRAGSPTAPPRPPRSSVSPHDQDFSKQWSFLQYTTEHDVPRIPVIPGA
jgi:hypothetical protein